VATLRLGLQEFLKAQIVGGIIVNLLLVLGLAMFLGSLRPRMTFMGIILMGTIGNVSGMVTAIKLLALFAIFAIVILVLKISGRFPKAQKNRSVARSAGEPVHQQCSWDDEQQYSQGHVRAS